MQNQSIPGFVDLQVNGCIGVDFSSDTLSAESFARAAAWLRAQGTAVFLPTVITSPLERYRHALALIGDSIKSKEYGSAVAGIHLEGPFVSRVSGAVGAHNPDWVCEPDTGLLDSLIEWSGGTIRLLTLAPELPGASELIAHAARQGIAVSLGHTLGSEYDFASAAQAGARALTHLGNGVPNTLPRHDNPIWAGLAQEELTAMIITDGHHLPASVIRSIVAAKGIQSTIVVSDSASLAGLPPGHYETLGNQVVLESNGKLHNPQKSCLVGSSACMRDCMNHLAATCGLTFAQLADIGFNNPLALIGLNSEAMAFAGEGIEFDPTARRFTVC